MSHTTAGVDDLQLTDISAFRRAERVDSAAVESLHPESDASEARRREYRIALIAMPFSSPFRPSIPVGLVKAIGTQAGLNIDEYYLNVDLAAYMGFDEYDAISNGPCEAFTGEWLGSVAAFGDESNRADYLRAEVMEEWRIRTRSGRDAGFFNNVRENVLPDYFDGCLDRFDWGSYDAIAFVALLQGLVGSLALARRIKARYPHVTIILGGSNMEPETGNEYMRTCEYIDYAVVSEADAVYPALLCRLADGRGAEGMLGVMERSGDTVNFAGGAPLVRDLDGLPVPDYDAFYEAIRRHGLDKYVDSIASAPLKFQMSAIPFESSRGCWWGEKSHCTFCGMLGPGMAYRKKSPERMLAELDELSRRYGKKNFMAADAILDMRYIPELFGPLQERADGYQFFYCIKSNLTRDQVRAIAKGGLMYPLAGIESLNSHVLQLMRKGVTKLQNVNFLRWSQYYGIHPFWNLLHGFPGERIEDYEDQLTTMRLITHLRPPMAWIPLRMERHSPNFMDKELFPTNWQRPASAYSHMYPESMDHEKIAFFFDFECAGGTIPEASLGETAQVFAEWRDRWAPDGGGPTLTFQRDGGDILVEDSRSGQINRRTYTLLGLDADVYEAFSDAPRTPAQVCAAFRSECPGQEPDADSIKTACEDMCDAGLMISEAGKYLSLAIPADPEHLVVSQA